MFDNVLGCTLGNHTAVVPRVALTLDGETGLAQSSLLFGDPS